MLNTKGFNKNNNNFSKKNNFNKLSIVSSNNEQTANTIIPLSKNKNDELQNNIELLQKKEFSKNNEIIKNNENMQNKEFSQNNKDFSQNENNKEIYFNDNINSYVIYFNNQTYTLSNVDIIQYIQKFQVTDPLIENFIFTISVFNDVPEYKFVYNSTFTKNIDIMFKLQNDIYNILQENDFITQQNLFKFYYQLIIFIYKTPYNLNYEITKINNIFSFLSYRFSTIILKQNIHLQQQQQFLNTQINKINNDKHKIHLNINKLNEKIDNLSINSNNSYNTENSNNSNNTENSNNSNNTENTNNTNKV